MTKLDEDKGLDGNKISSISSEESIAKADEVTVNSLQNQQQVVDLKEENLKKADEMKNKLLDDNSYDFSWIKLKKILNQPEAFISNLPNDYVDERFVTKLVDFIKEKISKIIFDNSMNDKFEIFRTSNSISIEPKMVKSQIQEGSKGSYIIGKDGERHSVYYDDFRSPFIKFDYREARFSPQLGMYNSTHYVPMTEPKWEFRALTYDEYKKTMIHALQKYSPELTDDYCLALLKDHDWLIDEEQYNQFRLLAVNIIEALGKDDPKYRLPYNNKMWGFGSKFS